MTIAKQSNIMYVVVTIIKYKKNILLGTIKKYSLNFHALVSIINRYYRKNPRVPTYTKYVHTEISIVMMAKHIHIDFPERSFLSSSPLKHLRCYNNVLINPKYTSHKSTVCVFYTKIMFV